MSHPVSDSALRLLQVRASLLTFAAVTQLCREMPRELVSISLTSRVLEPLLEFRLKFPDNALALHFSFDVSDTSLLHEHNSA